MFLLVIMTSAAVSLLEPDPRLGANRRRAEYRELALRVGRLTILIAE
jgi:hypothetical protein